MADFVERTDCDEGACTLPTGDRIHILGGQRPGGWYGDVRTLCGRYAGDSEWVADADIVAERKCIPCWRIRENTPEDMR